MKKTKIIFITSVNNSQQRMELSLFFTESDMEEIIAKYPILIEDQLTLLGRQVSLGSLRVDLLFRDRFDETLVVELKKGVIKREHVGQIMEYSGTLYDEKPVRLMLVSNRVPPAFRRSLEYHGIEWREITQERFTQFLIVNDKPLLERLQKVRPSAVVYKLRRQKLPERGIKEVSLHTITDVRKVFENFRAMRNFVAGEGIVEESVDSWQRARKEAKEKYAILFSLENLENLTAEDFESFLYFRNNRSWTNLYRRGLEATRNMSYLKKALTLLQDESVDIRTRINLVLHGGNYHVKGIGKNIVTAILHVCDKRDRYGVWNGPTEGALEKLRCLPRRTYNNGEYYYRINTKLNQLKKELQTDLIMVDSFIWHVNKEY